MKKSNTLFIAIYVILTICSADLYAQIALYVSKQTNEFTQHSGSDSKTTDKYEHGTVTINLNPSSDCPITYTLTPNDFSINVNETKSWQGVVKPDLSHIPTPGTSANASINGDYDVHFSRPEGGSGGSIEGGYDCGKCPVHTSGGHHDLIHKTGTITKDFVVHSVLVDIPDSIPCNDGIATLNATYYPAGGTLEWTTPSGTLTGNNLSYTLPTPLTDNIIRVKYTIYGVSYSDTGYVRIAKLTGFNLPCCADTTQVVKDIAELTFDGVCHPKIKYTPDTVEQPALLPYYTYTVTAIDSNSGVSLTDTIVIVNKNQALSVTPLAADFSKIGEVLKTAMEAFDNGGVSPCTPSGSFIPSGSVILSNFKQCCPASGCVIPGKKVTGGVTWGYGATCQFPILGCPYIASIDLVVSGGASIDLNVSGETSCSNFNICGNVSATAFIGGGIGYTMLFGFASGNIQLVINGISVNCSYCFEPPPAQGKASITLGSGSITGTAQELWGLISHNINYPLWSGWTTPEFTLP